MFNLDFHQFGSSLPSAAAAGVSVPPAVACSCKTPQDGSVACQVIGRTESRGCVYKAASSSLLCSRSEESGCWDFERSLIGQNINNG